MAKILRTEQLSVDGDNIRLTATDGNLIINSVSGDELTQITSTTKIGEDISSLAVRDTGFDTDVSSLAANTSSVESMLVNVSKYGVYSLKTSNLSTGAGSSVQTITLVGRAFVSEPTVTATLTGTSNDPIIAVMISDVSETATTGVYQVTFQFSDELPATGETDQATSYKLNILANVNAVDQDLDTIVDSLDSDRDGDGMLNILDYDPDDSSVGKIISAACADISLHIQSDTTNGSTSFTDLSSNTHAITVLGDTQHSTTEAHLGSTSMAFDGTGDYLRIGDTSAFKFLHDKTSNWTIDFWMYRVTNDNTGTLFSNAPLTVDIGVRFKFQGDQKLALNICNGTHTRSFDQATNNDVPVNQWVHMAVCYDGSNVSCYMNGQLEFQDAWTNSVSTSAASLPMYIGRTPDSSAWVGFTGDYFTGYLQDFRITKKAIYTSNFIPSNSLLNNPCQIQPVCEDVALHIQSDTTNSSTTFTDLSSNAHAISVFGDAQHSTTYAYLGSTSMAFDGSGDYLSVGDRSTFKFLHDGTTDYTVECWVNFSTLLSGVNPIIGTAGKSDTIGFSLYYAGSENNNNEWRAVIWKGSAGVAAGRVDISDTPETNRWYHVAAVHKSNILYFYIDGVLGGSDASANYLAANSYNELRIGSIATNTDVDYSDCRIQDIRISKKAIYTTNFIPKNSLLNNPC